MTAEIGHNSGTTTAGVHTGFAKEQLKSLIERIENREEAKAEIAEEVRDIYKEAAGNGYDVKSLRTIVRMRKQDPDDRAEAETILESYLTALGMI